MTTFSKFIVPDDNSPSADALLRAWLQADEGGRTLLVQQENIAAFAVLTGNRVDLMSNTSYQIPHRYVFPSVPPEFPRAHAR